MTTDMQIALAALRKAASGYEEVKEDGSAVWKEVYLDNAKPEEWSRKKWAGVLSALEKAGVYERVDGLYFGDVKLAD